METCQIGAASSLGDLFRRMRAKLGPARCRHGPGYKLARILYATIKAYKAFVPRSTAFCANNPVIPCLCYNCT
jgi:hypothetical protein